MSTPTYQLEMNEDVVARRVGEETVLLDLDSGVYFTLNQVGSIVWRGLERSESVATIVARIVAEYDVATNEAEADVAALLEQLAEKGLLKAA